jgi:hypothetical protein
MGLFSSIKEFFANFGDKPLAIGKCSFFGGPRDLGVGPSEGLALIEPSDLQDPWFGELFLDAQPEGTTGLARRLDPTKHYIAMRWAYDNGGDILPGRTKAQIRQLLFKVTANGHTVYAQPADWGPALNTGRVADLSPQCLTDLGIKTNDIVKIDLV